MLKDTVWVIVPYSSLCLRFPPQRRSVAQPAAPQAEQPAHRQSALRPFRDWTTKRQLTHFSSLLKPHQPPLTYGKWIGGHSVTYCRRLTEEAGDNRSHHCHPSISHHRLWVGMCACMWRPESNAGCGTLSLPILQSSSSQPSEYWDALIQFLICVNPDHETILLLFHHCNGSTVMICNVSIWSVGYLICGSQGVKTHTENLLL